MTSETTSPAPGVPGAFRRRGEWSRYWDFVKRPALPARARPFGIDSLTAVLRLLGLDLLIMLGLVLLAGGILLLGLDFPENELSGMELNPLLVAAIVVGAPLMEETVFRGWLSGRPGHVLAILILGAAVTVIALTDMTRSEAAVNMKALGLLGAALVLSGLALFVFRKHGAMRWFGWAFPLLFWLSTLCFALIHLFNYLDRTVAVLPLVIPQLVAGSIFAYARVHYGLWSSILLHALHNGAAVGAVLVALSLGS